MLPLSMFLVKYITAFFHFNGVFCSSLLEIDQLMDEQRKKDDFAGIIERASMAFQQGMRELISVAGNHGTIANENKVSDVLQRFCEYDMVIRNSMTYFEVEVHDFFDCSSSATSNIGEPTLKMDINEHTKCHAQSNAAYPNLSDVFISNTQIVGFFSEPKENAGPKQLGLVSLQQEFQKNTPIVGFGGPFTAMDAFKNSLRFLLLTQNGGYIIPVRENRIRCAVLFLFTSDTFFYGISRMNTKVSSFIISNLQGACKSVTNQDELMKFINALHSDLNISDNMHLSTPAIINRILGRLIRNHGTPFGNNDPIPIEFVTFKIVTTPYKNTPYYAIRKFEIIGERSS